MAAERLKAAPLAVGGLGAVHLLEGMSLGLFLWSLKDVSDPAWAVRFPLIRALTIGVSFLSAAVLCLAWGLVRGCGMPLRRALSKIVLLNLPLLLLVGNASQGGLNHTQYLGAYIGALGVKMLLVVVASAWVASAVALLSSRHVATPHGGSARAIRVLPLVQSGLAFCMVVTWAYLFYHIETGLFRHQILEDLNRHLWVAGSGDVHFASTDPPYMTTVFWSHLYPMYLLLGPLYHAVGGNIHTVVALQVTLFILGAIPVFRLAKRILDNAWAALSWAIAYLWYPPLHAALFRYGFYVDLMAMPFLLCALEALFTHRIRSFWAWLAGFMLWKESTMPLLATLGFYLAIDRRWRWLGLCVTAVSLAWLFAGMHIATLMNGGVFYNELYRKTVLGWLQAPQTFFQFVIEPKNLANLVLLLLPFGLLSAGSSLLLVTLPMFYVIAIHPASRYVWLPYYGLLLPIFLMAALWTCRDVMALFKDQVSARAVRRVLIALPVVATLFSYVLLGPFSYYRSTVDPSMATVSERDLTIRRVVGQIPTQASVAASPWLHTLLDGRRWLYFWPVPVSAAEFSRYGLRYETPQTRDADYVVVDLRDPSNYLQGGVNNPALQALLRNPAYHLLAYEDQFLLFRRGQQGNTLRTLVTVDQAQTTPSLSIFDQTLVLLRCELDRQAMQPGGVLRVTYFWRCLNRPAARYAVSTRFVQEQRVLFSSMHEPLDGLLPATEWREGETIRDRCLIPVPAELIPTAAPVHLEVQVMRMATSGWVKAGSPLVVVPNW